MMVKFEINKGYRRRGHDLILRAKMEGKSGKREDDLESVAPASSHQLLCSCCTVPLCTTAQQHCRLDQTSPRKHYLMSEYI